MPKSKSYTYQFENGILHFACLLQAGSEFICSVINAK